MNLEDHFSKKEIEKLNKLPGTIRTARWIIILSIIPFAVLAILYFYSAMAKGRHHGIHGVMNDDYNGAKPQ